MLRSISILLALVAITNGAVAQTSPSPTAAATTGTHGPKISFSSVNPDGPYIALTFDDGPGAATTPRLLEMLAKRNIKVTFFVVGQCASDHPELLKRELAEGHEIGNHSWDHPNLGKKSDAEVRSQLQRTQDAIVQATGITPKLMRPPYGSLTERQRRWVNDQFGYRIILWEVDPLDWKRPGASVIAHRILSETRNGSIILAHDIHAQTIDAMPEVLDGLLAKGYKFVTVSELLAMDRPGKPKPVSTGSGSTPATKTAPVAPGTPSPEMAPSAAPSAAQTTPSAVQPTPLPPKKNDLPDSL